MRLENIIEISAIIIVLLLRYWLVPKDKKRESHVAFLIMQIFTWLFGFLVVEFKLLEYPIRLFSYAARTSFTFEYFVYPAISSIFYVYYPGSKSWIKQFNYYILFSSAITILELILLNYTHTINYINWTWYLSFITLVITLFLSKKYCDWFFKIFRK